MACCPFHDDKHPSMKVDRRFHCFACQADGDVIDFTSRLFGLSSKEAALKLRYVVNTQWVNKKYYHPFLHDDLY